MAAINVTQRNAHLARNVQLGTVETGNGPVAKALMTAISNSRRGSGDGAGEVSTAIRWVLWGVQAENAAKYLVKGSHVNVVGRMEGNSFERDGETIFGFDFTAEEVDYLDTRAESEALRARLTNTAAGQAKAGAPARSAHAKAWDDDAPF